MSDYTSSAGLMWPATFPGSENVDDPHCTVVYLGDVKAPPLDNPLALLLVTNDYLAAPGEVAVTGIEKFPTGGSGGDAGGAVWVARLDDSTLGPLRAEIKAAAEHWAFKDASSFPDFKPHVTLGKYNGEDSRPEAPKSVNLGELEAWWGAEHVKW